MNNFDIQTWALIDMLKSNLGVQRILCIDREEHLSEKAQRKIVHNQKKDIAGLIEQLGIYRQKWMGSDLTLNVHNSE